MKFLNFPPKISPRMSVEGEEWSLPEPSPPPSPHPTSLTSPSSLLTGDTSNLICQHSQKFLQSHISPDCYKCVQMSRSHPRKYICLLNDQSPGKYWIQKLVDNLLKIKLLNQIHIIELFYTRQASSSHNESSFVLVSNSSNQKLKSKSGDGDTVYFTPETATYLQMDT